jgi:hypothetical protein
MVENQLLDPEDFNEIGIYNPRNLKHGATKVAAYLAHALDTEVILVKHLATGDREEGYYNAWTMR